MNALNIFVTGATSAAGREAVRQLSARGHKVTGLTVGSQGGVLVRTDGGLPTFSDPLRAGELKSLLKLYPYDVVLNFGTNLANTYPGRNTDWAQVTSTVTQATNAILEAAASAGIKFLVHLSSTLVYGDAHGETVTEDSKPHGSTFRPLLNAEKAVLNSGIPACVLRAGIIYSGEDEAITALGEDLKRGRGIYLGDSHAVLNWVHAADVASAAVLAAEQQPTGQVFNIVDDNPASSAAFAGYVGTSLGAGVPAGLNAPEFALKFMTGEAQRTLLNTSARASNEKAKQTLGWKPKYPTLQAGLEQTLLLWRAKSR